MIVSNTLNLDLEPPHKPDNIEHAVFSLLATYLPQNSSMDSNEAAEKINDLVPSHRPGSTDEHQSTASFLFQFWELMFCIAPQLDYRDEPMQRFISLIQALRNLPETIEVCIQDGSIHDGRSVWRDGLYFGLMLHERWNQIPEHKTPEGLYALRWRNMNGLLAHFTNHNVYTGHFQALACISHALEEFRRKKPKTPINHRVPAAAIWFVLCPSTIYQACQGQEFAHRELSGSLWKGEPQQGYSVARWNFWRKRFEELKGHLDATEDTREACKAAIEGMDKYTSLVG